MKTIATVTFEIDWENKYESSGEPDMENAIQEHLNKTTEALFDYEWDMEEDVAYVEGSIKTIKIETVNLLTPVIKPIPFCEHCGEGHEEFGCEFNDDGILWCLDCYLSDKPNSTYLYEYYNNMVNQAEIKFLEKKLSKLKNK